MKPMFALLQVSEDKFGIVKGTMTTTHSEFKIAVMK